MIIIIITIMVIAINLESIGTILSILITNFRIIMF